MKEEPLKTEDLRVGVHGIKAGQSRCERCGEGYSRDKIKMELDKYGRKAKCPHCGRWMYFHRMPKDLRMTPNGQVWRADRFEKMTPRKTNLPPEYQKSPKGK